MTNLKLLGVRVKEKRVELKITQEELAKKVGYTSRSSINKIELGLVDLSHSKIIAISNALRISPAYLMGWTDEPRIDTMNAILKALDINENEKALADYPLVKALEKVGVTPSDIENLSEEQTALIGSLITNFLNKRGK